MPTPKLTPTERGYMQYVKQHVCDTAMHIIHDSSLSETHLWPSNGFKAGYGIGCEVDDRIYYFSLIYDEVKDPNRGGLQFNVHNEAYKRATEQIEALKTIFHQAYLNNVYFEAHDMSDSVMHFRHEQFIFTYTPQND